MNLSVVIPTYKNKTLFLDNLRHNLPFLDQCEIIVVNDDPSESLKHDMSAFPQVHLIENKINKGFAGAVNVGVHAAKHHYVMLLNTDVKLRDTSYATALAQFAHGKSLFAVSFAQIEKNGKVVGKNKLFWKEGFLQHSRAENMYYGKTGWAEGGSCIVDRQKYKELGGLDELFNPFYWEDIDLSYRAWKKGYTIVFDPHIVVEHHHESTIGTYFSSRRIKTIAYRNQLMCIWKNITDETLLAKHNKALAKQLAVSLFTDFAFVNGFVRALIKIPDIIKARKSLSTVRSDHELFSQFNS